MADHILKFYDCFMKQHKASHNMWIVCYDSHEIFSLIVIDYQEKISQKSSSADLIDIFRAKNTQVSQ